MIDFHCHLDLYEDPLSVIREADIRGCRVLAVTTTPLAWDGTFGLVGSSDLVRVAVGLHPELVSTRSGEIGELCALVSDTLYVGEIGLDGTRPHRGSLWAQERAFDSVLAACARAGGRIMSIHSRGATSLVLDHLEVHQESGVPVLHWFSGTRLQVERAVRLGCWFSVGPAMLRGRRGQHLVLSMPRDRVLTETDGPFAREGGRPLMPWDVVKAEDILGKLWKATPTEVEHTLACNLNRLSDAIGSDEWGSVF